MSWLWRYSASGEDVGTGDQLIHENYAGFGFA